MQFPFLAGTIAAFMALKTCLPVVSLAKAFSESTRTDGCSLLSWRLSECGHQLKHTAYRVVGTNPLCRDSSMVKIPRDLSNVDCDFV